MNLDFNINTFIAKHITGRENSLFAKDIATNKAELAQRINGRSVLVIGGAGSIGSSYIKALLHFKPSRLYVVDINENGLTELTRDLRSSEHLYIPEEYLTYPINFGDEVFEKIFRQKGPFDIVANFAAHKHVRSEKDHFSIEAMVENNVFKAKKLLDLLVEFPPKHFFCVSTDKAANPVNVMGASKKMMEEVILAYSKNIPITTARFANVAFSNGSLLAGFIERVMKRQPLSAPLDVKRYFVSPEESGQICLLACMLGNTGEIFFPRLEEADMKKFSDIGSAFLQSMGYKVRLCSSEQAARTAAKNIDGNLIYPVYYFSSDTSGEKSFEEFFTVNEEVDLEKFGSLGIIKNAPRKEVEEMESTINSLKNLFLQENVTKLEIVSLISELVPTFAHIETGKSLDGKM